MEKIENYDKVKESNGDYEKALRSSFKSFSKLKEKLKNEEWEEIDYNTKVCFHLSSLCAYCD